MITEEIKEESYRLITEFIQEINHKNLEKLAEKFFLDEAVFEEIMENLEDFFGKDFVISPPPLSVAFERGDKNRPNMDIYEMNEPNVWGIECILWLNGRAQEPILHAEVFGGMRDLKFRYKYMAS